MMFIEAVLKSLCNVYNVLIKKKNNQASYRKICIAEAGMELFFFYMLSCWLRYIHGKHYHVPQASCSLSEARRPSFSL